MSQLLHCISTCGFNIHALAIYLHLSFTAPPVGGAFGVQSNIYHEVFLAEIVNVLRPVAAFATRVAQRNLGLPLSPNSLDLHQTQKEQQEILD